MAKVQGLQNVVAKLRALAAKSRKDDDVSVSVGYATRYATRVHEDLKAFHPHGVAKYLERPARELANDGTLAGIVLQARRRGQTTATGLLLAGLRLQRESQLIVPVDTGALRNSAHTRLDGRG